MGAANLALRFLLELCLLAGLAYWGVRTGDGLVASALLGAGAPLLAALAWGLFVSPRAAAAVDPPTRLAVELALFSLGAAALWHAGRPALAAALAAAVALHQLLRLALRGVRPRDVSPPAGGEP